MSGKVLRRDKEEEVEAHIEQFTVLAPEHDGPDFHTWLGSMMWLFWQAHNTEGM